MTTYISAADTAKYVRKAIKEAYPDVKFSVRSKTYSGGASIDVHWTDGPPTRAVEPVTRVFEGSDFDGMIDLKTSRYHYLLPNGEVQFAGTPGTEGSLGVYPAIENPQPINAERVHFMANFIFCSRSISNFEEQRFEALAYIRAHSHCDGEPPNDRFGCDWVSDLANGMIYDRDQGEPWELPYRRIALREAAA